MSDNIVPIQDKGETVKETRRVPWIEFMLVLGGLLLTVLWVAGLLWAALLVLEWVWRWL
ncbi:hypothetical protein [Lichenifustis flavocetrariae]|uniref:Uncharacterized protein n=1 Tax=Lichenifustis flavocetrariae TaxID=2949735 RepID=A0AA41Z514_9HYPH|nr:hypothetical protein [Lichenifustis flavocetrariae]MCW6513151.1 hypothetical protein [Lichenifustis flavocetrariae]